MTEKQVVIFGGKGTAVNIAEQIENARIRHEHHMKVVGFAIDDLSLGNEIAGFPVVSGVQEAWLKYRDTNTDFIFALFRPDVMKERLSMLNSLGIPESRFANFLHPAAYVSSSVQLGFGNVVLAHTTVQSRVSMGNFNILNSNVVVEHDSVLGNGVFLAASACIGARVRVGSGVFVGLDASVREDVVVSDYAFIGMGSCVVQPVATESTVYGVPAKIGK